MNLLRGKCEDLKKGDANHGVTLSDFRNRHFERSKGNREEVENNVEV